MPRVSANSVAFSPDGKKIAAATDSGDIYLGGIGVGKFVIAKPLRIEQLVLASK